VRKRFSAPEWGLLWEVPNGTGARKGRTLDALAMSVWPSRGLELHGLELKISRSDLTRELRTPDKADAVGAYCDRFWIVCPNGLATPEDMPPAWGLLLATPKTLRVAKEAEKLEPKEIDRGFLASLFRQMNKVCADYVHRSEIAGDLEAARLDAHESALLHLDSDAARNSRELDALRETVKTFEEAAGVEIESWSAGDVGAAVEVVLAAKADGYVNRLARFASGVRKLAGDADDVVADWKRANTREFDQNTE
jgi:hypothetical protein